jgi:serine/threonine protein kinase
LLIFIPYYPCDIYNTQAIKIVDKHSRRRQLGYGIPRSNSSAGDIPLSPHGGGRNRRSLDARGSALQGNYLAAAAAGNEQKIRREIAILKKCVHPHVVRLKEVIDDPASRKIYMGMSSLVK